MSASPPVLRGGFRPFFFAGALWGLIALSLWILALVGAVTLPSHFDALSWHRHEMLFGFVGAVVAGFLLTAIPNWTGRLPIAGKSLVALFTLWAAARMAVMCSAWVGGITAATLDIGFYAVLGLLAAREVLASNNRNLPIVGMVLLLGGANAADHAGVAGLLPNPDFGWQLAVALVTLMISLIGGRIIPSFTRNWMAKQGGSARLPTQPGRFDLLTVGFTALGFLAWLTAPSGVVAGGLLILAAVLQAVRLARWGGVRALKDPLVFILHVGYAWVPLGLFLLGLSVAGAPIPRSAAVHALTAGAMGTMILAVMSRATLGHTGRNLQANSATVGLYCLVTLGALLRVAAPLGYVDYAFAMEIAAVAWGGALLLFLLIYGPMLWRPAISKAAG